MPWSAQQRFVSHLSQPLRRLIALYTLLIAVFTVLRLLRFSGWWIIDLANTFAPYWYMPLVLTFPLSIIITRQSDPLMRLQRKDALPPHKSKHRQFSGVLQQRDHWSVLLQIALLVLGLYWFALPGRYKPVDPPQGDTFRVVTFNVQGTNRELNAAMDWLLAAEADVIVLQETGEGYDQRLERLYDVYAHEDHIEGSVRIFSRYAILERQILTIEDDPGRLALRLVLDQNSRELAVYAVHLVLPQANWTNNQRSPIEMALRYDEKRRNAQARRLLEIVKEETRPFLVAGDFNMSDSSLIYDEIAAALRDSWRSVGTGAGRTWPVAEEIGLPRVIHPFLRIDYIWHSEALRAVAAEIGEAIGSDHLPVKVDFEWL